MDKLSDIILGLEINRRALKLNIEIIEECSRVKRNEN